MRARPLVWITLAAALLCAVFAFVRMENLPKDPISGEMTAVIAQVSGDRLLLREVTVDGQPVRGGVMLYSEPCGCLMQEGMTIRMHTTLQPLEEETNPHGWSDKTWFAAKGVVYTCEGAVDAHSETAPYSLRGDLRSRMRSHPNNTSASVATKPTCSPLTASRCAAPLRRKASIVSSESSSS